MFGLAAGVPVHRRRRAGHRAIHPIGRRHRLVPGRASVTDNHAARSGAPDDQSDRDDRLELEESFCGGFHWRDSNAMNQACRAIREL